MKDKTLISFGERLRQLRKMKDLSQEKLADELGFHRTYIGMVERGERNISLKNIKKVVSFFNLSLEDFFREVI